MRSLETNIATAIAAEEIQGLFWLAELVLPGGTQYFSESGIFEWNSHTWQPFLDPENPHDGLKFNLKCDEKLETAINLVNINHGISDLFATNDPQGCVCKIYIYHQASNTGQMLVRGIMGKPERLTDTIISVPVSSYLHGPLTKLPSRVICRTCGLQFADGLDCPYDPAGGYGNVDPGTGLPYTFCPKSSTACTARGMRSAGPTNLDYFGGFEQWRMTARGKLNNSGFLNIGRKSYTSEAEVYDNFLGKALPLVYGEMRLPGIVYFQTDESEFRLVGAFIGEGQMQESIEILANGQPTHDFKYEPFFTHGFPGQEVPVYNGYDADPFSCTSLAIIRIRDEVALQPDRSAELSWRGKGRTMRVYYWTGSEWLYNDTVYSNDPIDIWMDLLARRRGGLGLGYDVITKTVCNERTYSAQVITDVDGVQRKRYTFNGAIQDHQPAGDILERIRDEFSMFYRDYGDQITYGFIRPNQSSVFTFSEVARTVVSNEDGSTTIEISEKSLEDVPNRAYFSFLDAANHWEKTTFHLESQEQIERAGRVVDESRFLVATTNVGQALRIASNWMERAISGNWFFNLSAPVKALAVEVGDVVTVTDDKIPGGSDTFLVTGIELAADFSMKFDGQLYRSAFYDDAVDDAFEDLLRGTPENPLRPPAEVENLAAAETVVVTPEGATRSEIAVTWTLPEDKLWKEAEVWYRDVLRDPADAWTLGDVTNGTAGGFVLEANEYRLLKIRVRSVSRYGIRRDLNADEIPEVELLADGSPDAGVPDAPVNLLVRTRSDDATIPENVFRVTFDAGAANWKGVHTIYIETNATLPFSDGTVQVSNGQSVSGSAGAIIAGDSKITDETKSWTPDDPALVGCIAILEDAGGDIQGRMVTGNTATEILTSGPWYRPTGSYVYRVVSNFTRENFRGYQFEVKRGDFNPLQGTFAFDIPLTNVALYFRVAAFNAFGISDWTVTAAAISNVPGYDTTQAPKVTGFTVTHDGYVAPDGGQRVLCTVQFTPPFPLGNFSHLLVLADYPIESGSGMEAGMGGQAGAGYFTHRIGEFWDSNVQFISQPTTEPVYFYGISINADGYYNPDWYDDGDYVEYQTTLTADDNPPGQVQNVDPEYIPGVGLQVKWDALAAADIASYEIHYRKAATEGGLATATWTDLDNTRSTFAALGVTPADSGYWFQFRVRGVDNIGQAGTWGESAGAQAYGTTLHPVSAPINLDVGKTWEYQAGVPIIHLAINWDNPTDPYYGGCEVWIIDADGGERWDLVPAGYSATGLALVGDGRTIQVHLYPMNTAGLVPDYGTYAASGNIVLTPDTVDVPEPDITARDGVNCVYLTAEIPAWGTFQKPYSDLEIYINSTNSGTGSTKILNTPVGHSSGSTERMGLTIPFPLLADIGGTWSQGTQYYFFAKLVDRAGNTSGYSADTDNSAVFLPGDLTDTGVADFNNAEEIMRFAAADRYLLVAWNAPTINGTSVYETQIQISDESLFARPVINATYNSKSGGHTFVPAVNGTFYIRVRYRNNSPAEWSSWFGRAKGDGTTYATVRTIADQTGDTGKMVGTDIEYQTTDLTGKDNIQLDVRLKSTAANAKTCYNVSVIWSATQANTKDEENVYASGLTAGWQDNDSWVTVSGATPATAWIGKVLQFYSATNVWDGWIITQIDATNKRVQLNGSFGAAKSGQTARVITPYWQRPNTWFKELGRDAGWHLDKSVWYSTTITEIQSGYTCYARLIPCNFYGVGTAKDISFTIPSDVGNIADKGVGYANDLAPSGSFSSGGYQWEKTANNTVDLIKTFSFTQYAGSAAYRADSFVICLRPGGGTPDPTTDKLIVFPVTHLSGSQDYELKITNLDPFTDVSIKLYQAKNTASGLSMNTTGTSGKYLADTDICYDDSSGDLTLATPSDKTSARVICKGGGGYAGVKIGNTYSNPNYYGTIEILESSAGNAYLTFKYNGANAVIDAGTGNLSITAAQITTAADLTVSGATYAAGGLDVTGEARCDTLRIDATPATGTITPDKVIEINMNGTVYQIPCKAKP